MKEGRRQRIVAVSGSLVTPRPRGPPAVTNALDEFPERNNPEAQGLNQAIGSLGQDLNRDD